MPVEQNQIALEFDPRGILPQRPGQCLYAVPQLHRFRITKLYLTF